MNDVRDEALGALLERSAVGIESVPVDRLPEVLRRGTRRRAGRFTATAAAVAVFVGAISWAGLSIREQNTTIPADVDDWRTFASLEDNGWTMQVPPPWRVQELPACPNAPERIGVIVTNTDFEFLSPRGTAPRCEDRLVFAGFPRDGVALAFHPRGSFPGLFEPPMDTTLPLAPELLMRTGDIEGGPLHTFQSVALDREWLGVIRRFVGPDASASDVAALDTMLGSFFVRGAPRWVEDEVSPVNELENLRITLVYPSGWNLRTYPRWSVIDAPNPIAALESPGIRDGSCRLSPFAPWIRFDRIRDPSVFVLISDATDSWERPDLTARPDVFRLQDAIRDVKGRCGDDVRALQFGFKEAGRQIHVDLMASWSVFRNQREMLLHILNSIRIEKA